MLSVSVQKMLAHTDAYFRRFLLFVDFTGCRSGDARRLLWEWINWAACSAVILPMDHEPGKRTRKHRTIPLRERAISLLKWLQAHCDGTGHVFRNSRGRPWNRTALSSRKRTIEYAARQ